MTHLLFGTKLILKNMIEVTNLKKRIMALVIAAVITSSCFTTGYCYTVGPVAYNVEIDGGYNLENAAVTDGELKIGAGGSAEYDIFLPFNSVSAKVSYSSPSDGTINFKLEDKTYSFSVTSNETEGVITFEKPERLGAKYLTISSASSVGITEITFNKEDVVTATNTKKVLPDLTSEEEALQTAVVIGENSSVIKVNGARRYIYNENPQEVPYQKDGTLYLPIGTLARALGYYYESIPQNQYYLVRIQNLNCGNVEFYLKDGKAYKHLNNAQPQEIEDKSVLLNGEFYMPVRHFAEMAEKSVGYKDGIVVIDNRVNVRKILADENLMNSIKEEFAGYAPTNETGTTYYVAQTQNASDENPGTSDKPLRTLGKAATIAESGDTVIIKSGIYRETLKPMNNGTASNPIIFKAEENADVIVSANEPINNEYEKYNLNGIGVFRVRLDNALEKGRNQIFYDGEALAEARHPNISDSAREKNDRLKLGRLWMTQGDITVSKDDKCVAVSDTDLEQPDNFWQGGTFVSLHGYGWALGTAEIVSSTQGRLNLANTTKTWWFNPAEPSQGTFNTNCGYITGTKNAIDIPAEWTVENGYLYIYPPEGETADTLKLEAKARQVVIDLANSQYVQIKGIKTVGGGVKMNNSKMCVIDGCDMRYISHYTTAVNQGGPILDDKDLSNKDSALYKGELGVFVGGSDNAIINSRIDYSAAGGVCLSGKYGYIENNIISNCGYMGSYAGGIAEKVIALDSADKPMGGNCIFNNTVYNSGRSVYNVGGSTSWINNEKITPPMLPGEVAYNEFYNSAICTRDVGVVYLHGVVMGNDVLMSKFHNNVCYDSWSCDEGKSANFGIYYDNYAEMAQVYDNIMFNTRPESTFRKGVFANGIERSTVNQRKDCAYIEYWNNVLISDLEDGKDGLTRDRYPNKQPFFFGSSLGKDAYTENYENLAAANNESALNGQNVEYSDGVDVSEGIVKFSGNGQWIKFSDVDFKDVSNILNIQFTQDIYNMGENGDVIDVIIGDTIENGKLYSGRELTTTSSLPNGKDIYQMRIRETDGKQNVFIRTSEYHSLGVESVASEVMGLDPKYVTRLYGNQFDTIIPGDPNMPPVVSKSITSPSINNTWPGTEVGYKGVKLNKEANTIEVAFRTLTPYAGGKMYLHIGDPKTEPVAEVVLNGTSWSYNTIEQVKLNKTLEPGTYDFYLTYEGEGKSSNLHYVGFMNVE